MAVNENISSSCYKLQFRRKVRSMGLLDLVNLLLSVLLKELSLLIDLQN